MKTRHCFVLHKSARSNGFRAVTGSVQRNGTRAFGASGGFGSFTRIEVRRLTCCITGPYPFVLVAGSCGSVRRTRLLTVLFRSVAVSPAVTPVFAAFRDASNQSHMNSVFSGSHRSEFRIRPTESQHSHGSVSYSIRPFSAGTVTPEVIVPVTTPALPCRGSRCDHYAPVASGLAPTQRLQGRRRVFRDF